MDCFLRRCAVVGPILLTTFLYCIMVFFCFFVFSLVYRFKNIQLRSLQGTLFDSRDLPACFAADAHRSIPPTVE